MQSMSPTYQCLNEKHIDLARCYQSHNNPNYYKQLISTNNQSLKHARNSNKQRRHTFN